MPIRLLDEAHADEARAQFENASLLAIDTEFHGERTYLPTLYLVQVHVPGADTWIIDPLVDGCLESVGPSLLAGATWLMHAGFQDLRLLQRAIGGVATDTIDTQVAAALASDHYPAGLSRLVDRWLGRELAKAETLSDWSKRPLGQDQIRYAAADVLLLGDLWSAQRHELERLDRLEIARAAFDEARHDAITPIEPREAWRDLTVAASLKPTEVCILVELAAWREEQARERDRPVRQVLGDAALKQISRSRPLTPDDLRANRRIPRSVVKRHSAEVLDAVARGIAAAEDTEHGVVRAATPAARAFDWLALFGAVDGHNHRYAPRLVLPKRIRSRIALDPPRNRALLAEILGDWRDRLVGDSLEAALSGNVLVRLGAPDGTLDATFSRITP